MVTDLLQKLVDNSLTLGLLGMGLYLMYKENITYRRKQEEELVSIKGEIHQYYLKDKELLTHTLEESTKAIIDFTKTNEETNKILRCIIPGINDFKKSQAYQEYLKEKE